MSIPEAVSILYSSLGNTGLNNTINHFVETFKHKSFLIGLKQDNSLPEHEVLLASAIEILDELIALKDYLTDINIDQIEANSSSGDDVDLTANQIKRFNKYKEAIELLEKSKKLGNTYAICLLGILKTSPEYLTLIGSSGGSVSEQEMINWLWLKDMGTMGEHSKGVYKYYFLIEEAANKGNQYALYVLGDMYLATDKQDKGIELLEKSYEQGNAYSAFKLGEFYQETNLQLSMHYLAYAAGKGHIDALHLIGIIVYNQGFTDNANDIWKANANAGHIESLITYMRYSSEQYAEKDIFYGNIIEDFPDIDFAQNRIIKKIRDQLLSYEKQKISTDRINTIHYKHILENIKKRIELVFPSLGIDIELLLETIFFKRDLGSLAQRTGDSNIGGIYLSKNNEIGIDGYLHLGVRLNIKGIREFVEYILSHEIIHQVSNSHTSLPRFINEGITEAINAEIMGKVLGYPNEVSIFKKLSRLSNINKDVLYDWVLNGQSQKIRNLLNANIGELIAYFLKKDGFPEELIEEMNNYKDTIYAN